MGDGEAGGGKRRALVVRLVGRCRRGEGPARGRWWGTSAGREVGAADGGPGLIDPRDPERAVRVVAAVVRAAGGRCGRGSSRAGAVGGVGGRRERSGAGGRGGWAFGTRDWRVRWPSGPIWRSRTLTPSGDGPGVLLVVGTGSAVRAVDPRGEVVWVGGWGGAARGRGERVPDRAGRVAGGRAQRGRTGAADRAHRRAVGAGRYGRPERAAGVGRRRDQGRNRRAVGGGGACGAAGRPGRRACDPPSAGRDPRGIMETVLEQTAGWTGPAPVTLVGGLVRADSPPPGSGGRDGRRAGVRRAARGKFVPERGALRLAMGLPAD